MKVIENIPVYTWLYKPEHAPVGDHGTTHIGPMAEDFQRMTGLGAPDKIDAVDYLGVLTAALQGALLRISELEAAVGKVAGHSDKAARVH
ncbi:MAG: tail fiber domain-containing protein [Pelagimonas sp.]|nr:tail fiber domain-containing protein [Pelagimonas sp.]